MLQLTTAGGKGRLGKNAFSYESQLSDDADTGAGLKKRNLPDLRLFSLMEEA